MSPAVEGFCMVPHAAKRLSLRYTTFRGGGDLEHDWSLRSVGADNQCSASNETGLTEDYPAKGVFDPRIRRVYHTVEDVIPVLPDLGVVEIETALEPVAILDCATEA